MLTDRLEVGFGRRLAMETLADAGSLRTETRNRRRQIEKEVRDAMRRLKSRMIADGCCVSFAREYAQEWRG